jgi:prepilin-type processing-associated H-X9-DG protein
VELLIVIGLIAVLIGLLMPALAGARRAARQAQCAGNLRQWAIAVNLYAQQNHNWLPRRGQGKMPTQTLTWYDDWFNELPPLLGQHTYPDLIAAGQMPLVDDHSIWICPELYGTPNSSGNLFGYAMNMALSPRDATYPDRIEKIGPASTMVFMADGPAGFCSTVPFVSSTASPAPWNPVPRHAGKVNLSFLDGHVSAYASAYVGCNIAGNTAHPDACNQPDVRWYWYVPGPSPAPWVGP